MQAKIRCDLSVLDSGLQALVVEIDSIWIDFEFCEMCKIYSPAYMTTMCVCLSASRLLTRTSLSIATVGGMVDCANTQAFEEVYEQAAASAHTVFARISYAFCVIESSIVLAFGTDGCDGVRVRELRGRGANRLQVLSNANFSE